MEETVTTALRSLRRHGRPVRYGRRKTVFARGAPGEALAIVDEGLLRIGVVGTEGRELSLALAGPGEILGEVAVLDDRPRSADVTTVTGSTLTLVPASAVRRLMGTEPAVAQFFVHLLCRRLRGANAQAEGHALDTFAVRLALRLVDLGDVLPDGSVTLRQPPSQSELARLAGGARESVNRQVRAWVARGLIVQADGSLAIPDPERLQEHAACSDP